MLGQDNAEALIPLKVRKCDIGELYGIKTLFGWSLNGLAKSVTQVSHQVMSNFIRVSDLDKKRNSLWSMENDGLTSDELF